MRSKVHSERNEQRVKKKKKEINDYYLLLSLLYTLQKKN